MSIRFITNILCVAMFSLVPRVQSMMYPLPCEESIYGVGVGQGDITGPIAESSMTGYADFGQRAHGLHMRLRARTFIIIDPCRERMSAIVVADLGMAFSSIKEGVLLSLRNEFGDRFNHENLLVTATHTHSGPGGYAYYPLYNVTSLGFDRANYDAIIGGIVESVRRAHAGIVAARISYGEREVDGVGFNRSLVAYENNPMVERSAYGKSTNETMHLLKFENRHGDVIGAINWLSVHPVSLTLKNDLVSGDNKGLAAYLLERRMKATYRAVGEFVGAFAQADAGDVSPYEIRHPPQNSDEEWAGLWRSAKMQADAAWALLNDNLEPISGELDFRHQFVDMHQQVTREHQLCIAGLGRSFAAGTENGKPPLALFVEGEINENPGDSCHAEKPILIPAGQINVVPAILPFQIIAIGPVTIVAAPSEMTTMAGRRLREKVAKIRQGPVIISGLSNEYSHYVATREEYAKQHYEGASTLYGPWTEQAYRGIFAHLAHAIVDKKAIDRGPLPADQSHRAKDLSLGVIFDSTPFGKSFGDMTTDAQARYRYGDTVSVSFVGAHPKNDLKTDDSYLTVEKLENGVFRPIYFDSDPNTMLRWQRVGLAKSAITITWHTTNDDEQGVYRICHAGASKAFLSGKITSYSGCTSLFRLGP